MKETLYRQAYQLYALRRAYLQRQLERWQADFATRFPELGQLEERLRVLRWQKLSAAVNRLSPSEREAIDRELAAEEVVYNERYPLLEKQMTTLSAKPQPQCAVCEDTGRDAEGALCKVCFGSTLRTVLKAQLPGFLPLEQSCFAQFDKTIFSDQSLTVRQVETSARRQIELNLEQTLKLVERINSGQKTQESLPSKAMNLFFTGQTGTGKTYLASCAVNKALDNGQLALLSSMLSIEEIITRYRTLQKSFAVKPEVLEKAEDQYILLVETPLLVLDDFGVLSGLMTDPLAEILWLLQQRRAQGGCTIITSNLNFQQIQKVYDERLLSRLIERFTVLPFWGDDLRQRK